MLYIAELELTNFLEKILIAKLERASPRLNGSYYSLEGNVA